MKRPVSIRASLLRNLIVMLAVIGIAIVVTATLGSRRAVSVFSEALVSRSIETVASRLDGFFAGPSRQLLLLRRQAQEGLLSPPGGAAFADASRDLRNRLLAPIIEAYPQVSAVILADSRGREHLLLREGERWRSREMRLDEWGSQARWQEWTDSDPAPQKRSEQLDYDPRLRPWFTGALAANGASNVHWTEPYTFFTTRKPGITASMSWDAGDGVTGVIGLDVELRDITSFTRSIQVGTRGLAGVLTDDRRFIGLPAGPRFDDPAEQEAAFLKHPEDLGLALFTDAVEAIGRESPERGTARFSSGGEPWWGRVMFYQLSPERRLHIAIAVPEADLIGSLRVQRRIMIGIVLAVLVVGAARAIVLSRQYSSPIEALVLESERLSRGDFAPGPPNASRVAEVRRLAEAHDRMREGLRSLIRLKKLEGDLDLARDIQRGLFPKAPPDARGFQVAGWNQAADETGGDYYDWITLPDGRVVVTLADVTGHGVGPALIASVCRAYMRATTAFHGRHLSESLAQVNDLLCDDTPPERFVTAAVAMIEPAGRLTLISAGQGPMLFYRAADGGIQEWDGDEPPLAVVRGLTFPNPREVRMERGDLLVLTTDGFFEWRNSAGERFGIPRLKAFVTEHHDLEPKRFIETLYAAVRAHAGGTPQADDLTAVVIRKL